MTAYFRWVLAHRAAVTVVVALLTLLALASISRAVVATSIGGMFLGESPHYLRYLDRSETFGNDEVIVLGFDAPDLLTDAFNAKLRAATDAIEALPDVRSATSVLDVQRMTRDGVTLTVSEVGDEDAPAALLGELRSDPFAGGLVLSETGDRAAVIVELTHDPDRQTEAGPAIVAAVAAPLEEAFGRVHVAGHMSLMAEILDESWRNILVIFPVVNIALLLIVWLMFHRLWPAAMSLGVSFIAVVWTLGVAVQMDRHVSIFMTAVPAIVLIVGFSDVVHLCSAYLLELGRGRSKDDAILASAEDVGRACFWTSLTTLVGFLSVTLIPTPIFRQMGIVLGLGVFFALLIAMTMCPILFSWLPQPKPLREGATSAVQASIDRALRAMQGVSTGYPRLVVAGFAVVFAVAVWGGTQVHIETDMTKRLEEDNPTVVANAWFAEHFASTRAIELFVEGDLLEPDVLGAVAALQREIAAHPTVDAVVSVVDLFEALEETQTGTRALPGTRAGLAQALLLFEMGGGADLDRMLDFDRRAMRMTLRLDTMRYRESSEIGDWAVGRASALLGERATVEASGMPYLIGSWLDEIMAGQRNGLLLSFVVIMLMMIVALRSLGAGLLSMIPNVLPLLCLAGWMGWFWDDVDSDTIIIGIIAIGIGVDDTVHFCVRFRTESLRTDDVAEALRRTFDFAGRAIVMTTVILVVGFLPWLSSNYFSTRIFGSLLPAALVVALVADLLLVPAMAQLGWLRFKEPSSSSGNP